MDYEKLFTVTVPVANPIHFSADTTRHLMTALRTTYTNKCYLGVYIRDIKRVISYGAIKIVSTNCSGEGSVDVSFLALVVSFSRWDILTGVEIVSRQSLLVGVYKGRGGGGAVQALVSILASKAGAAPSKAVDRSTVDSLAVGQLVPVRVVYATHPPMQPQACIGGALLVCDQTAPAYRLRGALDQSARAELAPMLASIEAALQSRAALIETRKADLWFFELLLCAYRAPASAERGDDQAVEAWKGGPVWRGPCAFRALEAGATPLSVLDIVRDVVGGGSVPVTGIWSRSLALYRSSPLVAVVRGGGSPPEGWVVTEGTPRAVFAEFLKNILDFLVATQELPSVYNTPKLIERHHNLWSIMRAAQRPAA